MSAGLYPVTRYGEPVTVRWYRRRIVGDAREAARVIGLTGRRSGETYQYYVRRLGAPGPLRWRDPDTGAQLFDLQDVVEWDRARPGRGARTDLQKTREGRS